MLTCTRKQINPNVPPCTQFKFKWLKGLDINPGTLNLIEEKIGNSLEHISTGDDFLNRTPIH